MLKLDAKIYRIHEDAVLPSQKNVTDAGFDLHIIEDFELYPGQRKVVATGIVVQPPQGYHTEIFLRSSMAYKHNIILINGVGLIDQTFSGPTDELKIMLYRAPLLEANGGTGFLQGRPVQFKKGDRVAQLVFRQTQLFNIVEVAEAPAGDRGGLGSTGA